MGDADFIHGARDFGMLQQRLDLRGEDQPRGARRIVEGPHAQKITRKNELAAAGIEQCQRKLAVHAPQAIDAFLLVEMQEQLTGGRCARRMAFRTEPGIEFLMIEDVSVTYHNKRTVFINQNGIVGIAGSQLEGAQPQCVLLPGIGVARQSIRPARFQRIQHRCKVLLSADAAGTASEHATDCRHATPCY